MLVLCLVDGLIDCAGLRREKWGTVVSSHAGTYAVWICTLGQAK